MTVSAVSAAVYFNMSFSIVGKNWPGLLIFSILMLACTGTALGAAPVEEYVKRLEQAEAIADQMIDQEPDPEELLAVITMIRQLIPRAEEISTSSQGISRNVRVDNGWLHLRLDELANIANGDPEQQRSMLIEIADRLFVLQERVNSTVKAEDRKAQLDAILLRNEYRPDEEKESIVRKWLRSLWGFIRRLLDKLPRPQPAQPDDPGITPFRMFSLVFGLLLLVGIGFGLFRFITRRRRRKRKNDGLEVREVLGEALPDDITAADLLRKASEIASQGDYRTAIRRAYIALLCELEERGKLSLHKSRTNRDYIEELRGEIEILSPFSQMTGRFEKTWYGQAETSAGEFDDYLTLYRKTVTKKIGQD